jgi:hypothetical protein
LTKVTQELAARIKELTDEIHQRVVMLPSGDRP